MAEAVVTSLFAATVSITAAATAQRIQRRNVRRGLLSGAESVKPTLADRGVWLPLVYGTQRVGPVVKWTGAREVHGGHGGKDDDPLNYVERALHFLTVGPTDQLIEVYRNNLRIWPGQDAPPLERTGTPSGTLIDQNTSDTGWFYVYWGEIRQPVNPRMSTYIPDEVATRYPNVTYIEWIHHLGGSPQWGQLEYVLQRRLLGGSLSGSSAWIAESSKGGSGVNPAHVLVEATCAPFPHGLGLPLDIWDGPLLEDLGALFEEEGLAMNFTVTDGLQAVSLVTDFMHDAGVVMGSSGPQLRPYALRPPSVVLPSLGGESVTDPEATRRFRKSRLTKPTSTYVRIMDEQNGWRASDLAVDDDPARNALGERPNAILLPTISNRRIAYAIGSRHDIADAQAFQAIPLNVHRSARNLTPGRAVTLAGAGSFVCTGTTLKPGSPVAELALASLLDTDGDIAAPPGLDDDYRDNDPTIAADLMLRAIQLPLWAAPDGGRPYATLLRVRASAAVAAAEVWVSDNGTTYARYGRQDAYAAAGTTNRPILASETTTLNTDPLWITGVTADWADVGALDLTGNDAEYNAGALCLLIEDELFFVRRVVEEPGGWYVDGLTRARSCTTAAAHPANSIAWLFRFAWQIPLAGASIQAGGTSYFKSRPIGTGVAGDLALSPVAEAPITAPACNTP